VEADIGWRGLCAIGLLPFGSGGYSIIGPYMAEIWPSRLRASGMGLAYGAGNLGKFIGPAGLAVIAGSSNFVSPAATASRRAAARSTKSTAR
jgi:hypothetical protein